jgi:DnaJ-class molecular chaperone
MSDDVVADTIEQVRAHEDSILNAVVAGEALCPNCNGRGHEGLGLLEADWPCRFCRGRGLLSQR